MTSFLLWLGIGLASVVVERVLAPKRSFHVTPASKLVDGIMTICTVVVVAVPPMLSVVLPGNLLAWPASAFCITVGAALGAGGVAFRAAAMAHLGFRYQLSPVNQLHSAPLATAGPYRLVRHPGYLGLVAQFVGMSLLFSQPIAALSVIPLLVAVRYRIVFEESLLREEFGARYLDYSSHTRWRVIPCLY